MKALAADGGMTLEEISNKLSDAALGTIKSALAYGRKTGSVSLKDGKYNLETKKPANGTKPKAG